MKQNKIGHYPFVVEPFQEDVTGHLSTTVLGNLLLRCANLQAGSMGYGYRDMIKYDSVWVLARLQVEMDLMPTTHEPYNVHTWFYNCYRQFSERHYRLTNDQGVEIGRATTVWSLINVHTRDAIDLTNFNDGHMNTCIVDEQLTIEKPLRVRVKAPTPARSLEARFSDLDINGHVNSIRYIAHALDLFDKPFHDKHHLHRYEISFSAESFCGDRLHLYHDALDELTHHIEIRVQHNDESTEEVACRIRFVFTPR